MSRLDELRAILAWLDHDDHVWRLVPGAVLRRSSGLFGVPGEVTAGERVIAREAVRIVDVSDCHDEQDVRARVASILTTAADLRQAGSPAVAATLREIAVAVHATAHHGLLALAVLES